MEFTRDAYGCSKDADAIVIATEWKEYKFLDWEKISNLMRKPSWVFDARSILVPEKDFILLGSPPKVTLSLPKRVLILSIVFDNLSKRLVSKVIFLLKF